MPDRPKMTLATQKVLGVLLSDLNGEHYGLEISKEAGLAPGSIYPILARLEKTGWASSAWEDIDESKEGRRRRRYYTLTALGAREARSVLRESLRLLAPAGLKEAPA